MFDVQNTVNYTSPAEYLWPRTSNLFTNLNLSYWQYENRRWKRTDLWEILSSRGGKNSKEDERKGWKMVCGERKDIGVVEQKKNKRGWPEKVKKWLKPTLILASSKIRVFSSQLVNRILVYHSFFLSTTFYPFTLAISTSYNIL